MTKKYGGWPLMAAMLFATSLVTTAEARTWTCHATIALQGTGYSYAVPSWKMSGGVTVDREKKCRDEVKAKLLNDCAIWNQLGIPPPQQDAYCQSGGTFRVDYGFDQRRKDWSFTQSSKPCCKCEGPLTFQ